MTEAPGLILSALGTCGRSSHAGLRKNTDEVSGDTQMQDINKQVARSVRFDIAKDRNEDFLKLFKTEVLPVLKKQDGFKDELLLVHDQHVLAISVWNTADAARKYETATYPQVDKALRPVMTGKPTIETFDYASLSTIA